jgi:hypothetical protein
VLSVLCSDTSFALAEEPLPEVQPIDGPRFPAELASIDDQGQVRFRTGRTLALDEFVRYGHPVDPRPQPVVLLSGGSRIVAAAAWAEGTPVSLAADTVTVRSDLLNELQIPRSAVRGVVFAETRHADDRRRLENNIWAANLTSDEIMLTNDERLRGTVTQIDRGTLIMKTDAGEAKLPLSRVLAVAFAPRRGVTLGNGTRFVVGLRDGSLLRQASLTANERELRVRMTNINLTAVGGRADDIVFLQAMTGPRLQYLSDLQPSSYRHVPYLTIKWPYQLDKNIVGGPLAVGGKQWLTGIAMHSASRITFSLDPSDKWRRFEASVAIDDTSQKRGSVTFGVLVLREGRWQPAFTSGIVRGGGLPTDVSVDVSVATGLTLTVDYADRGDELDHADWLDARLVR